MNSISTNQSALAMARSIGRNQDVLGQSLARLSSGTRLQKPSNDAAGVALSEKIEAQSRRNYAASVTVQNAISHIQASDGFLGAMTGTLTRLSELAARAMDPVMNPQDKALYQEEFRNLQQQLRDTVGGTTSEIGGATGVNDPIGTFNGRELFGGGAGVQINLGVYADQALTMAPTNLRTGAMAALITQNAGGQFLIDVDDPTAIASISAALDSVAAERSNLGAVQSRLGVVAGTLEVEGENMSSALSRIRDTDVATESTQLTKYKFLNESGTSMLAQANESPESVLRLLQE